MLEALWSVEFVSDQGIFGAGVVVFETGRVFGGDGQYFYLGEAKVENSTVVAEIRVQHYSGLPYSIFGFRKQFTVKLSGEINSAVMELNGHLVAEPGQRVLARLTKRADLP